MFTHHLSIAIYLILIHLSQTQDYLISPHEYASISIQKTQSHSDHFLIQVDAQKYDTSFNAIFAQYSPLSTDNAITLQFKSARKQNPQVGQFIKQCRFQGPQVQWCKVSSHGINPNYQLIKLNVHCTKQCNVSLVVGITSKTWNESTSPVLLPSSQQKGNANHEKTIVFAKIIGWMLLTLLLVLGAIQLAEKVATHFDRKILERSRNQDVQQQKKD